MQESKKYLVGICSVNEGDKIRRVLQKFNDYAVYDVLIIDDGSTDGSLDGLTGHSAVNLIRNEQTLGAGFGTRQIIDYGRAHGYAGALFVSGNDKDRPEDVHKLIQTLEAGFDLVQGSRFLPGGQHSGMPFYRQLATRFIHPWLFSLISRQRMTDSTNGFRALRLAVMDDPRLDIGQPWLDQYELEPYLLYKAIRLGYRVTEVPVSKIYPPASEGYTKMKPFSGWWSILRPIVLLGLGIKK